MKRVKFTSAGANAEIGNFEVGDEADLSDDMAKSLVDDMKSAEYSKGGSADARTHGPVHSTPESRLAVRKEREAATREYAASRPRNMRSVTTSASEVARGAEPLKKAEKK